MLGVYINTVIFKIGHPAPICMRAKRQWNMTGAEIPENGLVRGRFCGL